MSAYLCTSVLTVPTLLYLPVWKGVADIKEEKCAKDEGCNYWQAINLPKL